MRLEVSPREADGLAAERPSVTTRRDWPDMATGAGEKSDDATTRTDRLRDQEGTESGAETIECRPHENSPGASPTYHENHLRLRAGEGMIEADHDGEKLPSGGIKRSGMTRHRHYARILRDARDRDWLLKSPEWRELASRV